MIQKNQATGIDGPGDYQEHTRGEAHVLFGGRQNPHRAGRPSYRRRHSREPFGSADASQARSSREVARQDLTSLINSTAGTSASSPMVLRVASSQTPDCPNRATCNADPSGATNTNRDPPSSPRLHLKLRGLYRRTRQAEHHGRLRRERARCFRSQPREMFRTDPQHITHQEYPKMRSLVVR